MLDRSVARPVAETASERAYRLLRVQMLDGSLPPGTMALEGELAASIGVSRTPVREAMVRLADEGLIELRPRHGMRVRPISSCDMAEIYEVLVALESAAARRCAERGLAPDTLALLDATLARMDATLAAGDLGGWAATDADFHRHLVAAGGNRRLAAVVAGMADLAHRARLATLRLRPSPNESNRDHHALIAAIRNRDPARAEALHKRHRRRVGALLVRLLADLPGDGGA
jgi:DNA-binding GntR family transcriptional regulator